MAFNVGRGPSHWSPNRTTLNLKLVEPPMMSTGKLSRWAIIFAVVAKAALG